MISRLGVFFLTVTLTLTSSCASLMFRTTDIEPNDRALVTKGDTVAIAKMQFKSEAEANLPPMDTKEFVDRFQEALKVELRSEGVKLVKKSENQLHITITRFARGCGVCRGFFPLFGLGDSYLDAKIKFKTAKGKRIFLLTKDGQKSGLATMGDQSQENIGYLATKLTAQITGKKDED